MSQQVDFVLYGLCVCRAIAVLIGGIFALIISSKSNGLVYYALVEDEETWGPYCRAIIFPEAADGAKIDFGTYGGGTAVDMGVKVDSGLLLSFLKKSHGFDASAELRGKVLADSECQLMAVEVGKTEEKKRNKVLLMNAKTNKQIKMPDYCGGEEPGEWVERLNMWGGPLIISTLFWVVLKLVQVAVEAYLVLLHTGGQCVETVLGGGASLIASFAMSFFIAPIQNMKMDACPQIVTSWYSGVFQSVFAGIAAFSLFCSCGLFLISVCCAKQEPSGVPAGALAGYVMGGCGIFMLVLAVVGGFWYSYDYFLGYYFLGINFNLTFYWPEFSFAANLNCLHVFTFMLWLFDIIKVLIKFTKVVVPQ